MSHVRSGLSLAVALVLVVCGCGSDDPDIRAPVTTDPSGSTAQAEATDATIGPDGTELVAQAKEATLGVWSSPTESEQPELTLEADDEAAGRLVLLVKQEIGSNWLEVWLPTAPAGSTGWVRRSDVTVSQHRFRIEISRSAHTLTLFAGEVEVLSTPVAIGATDVPSPTDGMYIKDLIETPDPDGPYGRYAYGLSGFDNDAAEFASGSGVVAIHGTDDDGSLGTDTGQGSFAVGSEALDRLVASIGVPLGTPVDVVG
jgi:hypothetical protein